MTFTLGTKPAWSTEDITEETELHLGDVVLVEDTWAMEYYSPLTGNDPSEEGVAYEIRNRILKERHNCPYVSVTKKWERIGLSEKPVYDIEYIFILKHESPAYTWVIIAVIVGLLVAYGLIRLFSPAIYRYIGMEPEEVKEYEESVAGSDPFSSILWLIALVVVVMILSALVPLVKRK